jgi:hypothetical protein
MGGTSTGSGVFGGILERRCEFNIQFSENSVEQGIEQKNRIPTTWNTNLDDRGKASLATALSIDSQHGTAARWRAIITIDPIDGTHVQYNTRSGTLGKHHFFTSDETQTLAAHIKSIDAVDINPLGFAIGRYHSATTTRGSVSDSLVDAVVGLESLFGDRDANSLAIALCVAKLLGRDKDKTERDELFKLSKKIYGARSSLVHGAPNKKGSLNVQDLRNSAIDLLKKCILELLSTRPELMNLSARDRVKCLAIE